MSISRREFLRLTLLALSVSACQKVGVTITPKVDKLSPQPSPLDTIFKPESPTQTPQLTETPPPLTQTPIPSHTSSPQPTPTPISFIIDAHQDIAWNALEFGRDPMQSAIESRESETGTAVQKVMGARTSGFPEWVAGRVGLIFATLFVMPLNRSYGGFTAMTYASPQQAEEKAKSQLSFYRRLAKEQAQLRLVETQADLQAVIDSWSRPEMVPIVGLVILMEGADPVINPVDLAGWYSDGLRIVGPAWGATRYAGGTGAPGPLTLAGSDLLTYLASLDMILDLSHLAPQAFHQAVNEYPGVLIASHSNPHPFLPTDRGLDDEMIQLLADRDGVVGIMPYNAYLVPGWTRGAPRDLVGLDVFAQAIDYVVQLTGSSAHVGIGSDFDGGFGLESIPNGMDSIADLDKVVEIFNDWGYSQQDIDAIMVGNWLRMLQIALPS